MQPDELQNLPSDGNLDNIFNDEPPFNLIEIKDTRHRVLSKKSAEYQGSEVTFNGAYNYDNSFKAFFYNLTEEKLSKFKNFFEELFKNVENYNEISVFKKLKDFLTENYGAEISVSENKKSYLFGKIFDDFYPFHIKQITSTSPDESELSATIQPMLNLLEIAINKSNKSKVLLDELHNQNFDIQQTSSGIKIKLDKKYGYGEKINLKTFGSEQSLSNSSIKILTDILEKKRLIEYESKHNTKIGFETLYTNTTNKLIAKPENNTEKTLPKIAFLFDTSSISNLANVPLKEGDEYNQTYASYFSAILKIIEATKAFDVVISSTCVAEIDGHFPTINNLDTIKILNRFGGVNEKGKSWKNLVNQAEIWPYNEEYILIKDSDNPEQRNVKIYQTAICKKIITKYSENHNSEKPFDIAGFKNNKKDRNQKGDDANQELLKILKHQNYDFVFLVSNDLELTSRSSKTAQNNKLGFCAVSDKDLLGLFDGEEILGDDFYKNLKLEQPNVREYKAGLNLYRDTRKVMFQQRLAIGEVNKKDEAYCEKNAELQKTLETTQDAAANQESSPHAVEISYYLYIKDIVGRANMGIDPQIVFGLALECMQAHQNSSEHLLKQNIRAFEQAKTIRIKE
jgi:hypothetical protein